MSSKPPVDEKDVFNAARKIADAEAREQYLESVCGDDQQALQRVRDLLSVHETKETFLESPPVGIEATQLSELTEKSGDTIGPYKLLQQLGEGGMGVVYLAEQSQPVQRRVAVKIIKPGMDTRQVIARFEAERQALAIMDHPNIARVFDAGATDAGRPYFVMELVKGVPITQYCDEHRLDPRQRLELFKDVCHAVQHAHQKGIIHRDLKPSNVLVAEFDDQPVPKIIDFGVAKATQHRLTNKTMFTEVGTVVGTIEYMSPEQAKLNQSDIDTRSDIYSMGVLLYELLTGETPFDRKKLRSAALDEMLRIIREEDPSRPSLKLSTSDSLPSIAANRKIEPKRLSTLVRGELDWIVMKALEKDRSRRYDTANAFADDIENYLNDEAVQACPPNSAYRFKKFARRNKAVLATIGLVSAALILGLVGTSWQTFRATTAERSARDSEQRALDALDQKEVARREAVSSAQRAETAEEDQRQARQAEAQQRTEAERLHGLAESRALLARRNLYAAHMNLASQALDDGHITRTQRLLERHVPGPGEPDWRRFEWYYLLGQCQQDRLTIPVWSFFSLAFSPDSARLATADREHIAIWDVANGEQVHRWQAHPTRLHALAFSPDGKHLASGSYHRQETNTPGECILWDAQTGQLIQRLVGVEHTISALAFSPNGKLLAAIDGGNYDVKEVPTTVRLWDAETGTPLRQLGQFTRHIPSLAFSPDSQSLVVGGSESLRMWDVETAEPLSVGAMRGTSVAWSPDGKLLATNNTEAKENKDAPAVILWDPSTGQKVRELKFETPVNGAYAFWVDFSPDAMQVAAGMQRDNSVRVWDVPSGKELAVLRGHAGWAWRATFSPDGRSLASAGYDSTVRLWDTRYDSDGLLPGGDLRWREGHVKGRNHLAISPDGTLLAATQDLQNVALVELTSGETRTTLDAGSTIRAVCFSPDGQQIAVGSESGLHVWDTATAQLLHQRSGMVRALTFSPDGKQLFVSKRRSIEVYGAKDYGKRDVIREESFPTSDKRALIDMVVVSSDGRYLAAQKGDFRGTLYVWDLHRRQLHASFQWTRWFTNLAFSPDSKTLAASGGNWFNARSEGATKIWDVESRRELATIRAHDGLHTSLAFTPDGSTIATASDIGEITLWDLGTFEERITLSRGRTEIDCLAFSPNGSALLSGSTDESVMIWKSASPERVARYEQAALIRLAQEHRQSQNWDNAIAAYSRILETHENLPVRVLRGAAYAELGRWDAAAEDFAKAAGGPVDDPHDWPALATTMTDQLEKLARFEVDQHQHAKNNGDDVRVGPVHIWMALAKMHQEFNQDAKAQADYLTALQYDRTNAVTAESAEFLISRTVELLKQDERQRAISLLARLIECEAIELATSVADLKHLAEALIASNQWEEAVACYDQLVKLQPNNIPFFKNRAKCELLSQGLNVYRQRCRTAIEQFVTPKTSIEDKRVVASMCTEVAGAVDDTEAMVQLAREIATANPPPAVWNKSILAKALLRDGQVDEALAMWREIESEGGGRIRAGPFFALAIANHAAGQTDIAKDWLEKGDAWTREYLAKGEFEYSVFPLTIGIAQREAHERLGIPLASSE